jgi:hypothetical protein
VLLDGVKSSEKEVLSGVPQGTVLGPLLFLSFINDLPDVTTSSDARLFADDCLLFRHVCGSQRVDAYSSIGLAIVVQAAALTGLVQSLRFLPDRRNQNRGQ